ncbi:hypothetical protein GYMLUDRAFT_602613 [Collybiopsis luxurians FD-317 M1]|uniref:Uncharacterized protein n=1 Tax=Collybiopsis luxurians FD-317 M1 TaxID=944289 RepID=A0A0D0B9I4_9AGAR|nr:hypothetical protein GYMLUDRAFT_602613 [Collybiopsis luxurians FD-317 M1]
MRNEDYLLSSLWTSRHRRTQENLSPQSVSQEVLEVSAESQFTVVWRFHLLVEYIKKEICEVGSGAVPSKPILHICVLRYNDWHLPLVHLQQDMNTSHKRLISRNQISRSSTFPFFPVSNFMIISQIIVCYDTTIQLKSWDNATGNVVSYLIWVSCSSWLQPLAGLGRR